MAFVMESLGPQYLPVDIQTSKRPAQLLGKHTWDKGSSNSGGSSGSNLVVAAIVAVG
jgi:hypothetical protein